MTNNGTSGPYPERAGSAESGGDRLSQHSESQAASNRRETPSGAELTAAVERAHARALEYHDNLGREADLALKALKARKPSSLEEAILRFREHQRRDPHPNIPAGLLPSSSACTYIADTGMLYPFSFSREDLQLASLDLPLLGRAVLWDEELKERTVEIADGTAFELPPNSIAFVTLEPYLQLPDYIAIRFNLRVRNVYRGLLLGTGPLVDAGYQGRLAFPLHNLTNNPYRFYGGQRIVSVEFTKLNTTRNQNTDGGSVLESSTSGGLEAPFVVPFREPKHPIPDHRRDDPIAANFRKAGVSHVESSLPSLGLKVEEQSRRVDENLRSQNARITAATRWFTVGGAIALIGALVTLIGIAWQAQSEMRGVATHERELIERLTAAQQKVITDSLTKLEQRIVRTEDAICAAAGAADTSRNLPVELTKLCR